MKTVLNVLLISMSCLCINAQHSIQYSNYPTLSTAPQEFYPEASYNTPANWQTYELSKIAQNFTANSFTLKIVVDGCVGPVYVLLGPNSTFSGNTANATLGYVISAATTNANSLYETRTFGNAFTSDASAALFAFDRPNSVLMQMTSDGLWTLRVEDTQGNVVLSNSLACRNPIPTNSIKFLTFGATQTESKGSSQCDIYLGDTSVFVNNFKPNYPDTNELPSLCPASKLPCYCNAKNNGPKNRNENHNGPKNECGNNGKHNGGPKNSNANHNGAKNECSNDGNHNGGPKNSNANLNGPKNECGCGNDGNHDGGLLDGVVDLLDNVLG